MSYTILSAEEAENLNTAFPFAFLTLNNELVGADSRTGIVEGLIDGYESLTPDEHDSDPWTSARYTLLAQAAAAAQVSLLDAAYDANPELEADLSEDELTALLHPKNEETLEFDAWVRDEVPLVMMATDYAPYSSTPQPDGDGIVWVNCHDERVFLNSLERLGFGTLWVHEAAAELLDDEEVSF